MMRDVDALTSRGVCGEMGLSYPRRKLIDWRFVAVNVAVETHVIVCYKRFVEPSHSIWRSIRRFTPTMFSAYHREGYRASMEAEVEAFMSEEGSDATSVAFLV